MLLLRRSLIELGRFVVLGRDAESLLEPSAGFQASVGTISRSFAQIEVNRRGGGRRPDVIRERDRSTSVEGIVEAIIFGIGRIGQSFARFISFCFQLSYRLSGNNIQETTQRLGYGCRVRFTYRRTSGKIGSHVYCS